MEPGCQLVAHDTSAVTGQSDPMDKELVAGRPGFWGREVNSTWRVDMCWQSEI